MRPRKYPLAEIEFASRMGFITKPMWREFFTEDGVSWQNKRWNYFRSSGLFKGSEDHQDLLLPNPSHPFVQQLGRLVSRPPRLAQLEHDKVIAWTDLILREEIDGCATVVEAEAKRRDNGDDLDDKYPDLVLHTEGSRCAIEVELTIKSAARYAKVFQKYSDSSFDYIIYVVKSADVASAIEDAAEEANVDPESICFVSLKDWKKGPLNARLTFESETRKLKDLL